MHIMRYFPKEYCRLLKILKGLSSGLNNSEVRWGFVDLSFVTRSLPQIENPAVQCLDSFKVWGFFVAYFFFMFFIPES